ncbi:MAG: hypothetical protein AAF696_15425 [Bacteroidota bacterium]
MKTINQLLNSLIVYLLCQLISVGPILAQDYGLKKVISEDELAYLQSTMRNIKETDQEYRRYIANETLDDAVIDKMNEVYDKEGIEAYFTYQKSLNLSLDSTVKDSLWQLQHQIDLRNHLTLRGIIDTYGFLPESVLGKDIYIPLLVLMHPPKDWKPAEYLEEYSSLFLEEVKVGRMPAETFAKFYDNIKGKILREPQLYGTNEQFDIKSNKVLPPVIEDLAQSNEARKAIGMPELKEGEYRLWKASNIR